MNSRHTGFDHTGVDRTGIGRVELYEIWPRSGQDLGDLFGAKAQGDHIKFDRQR